MELHVHVPVDLHETLLGDLLQQLQTLLPQELPGLEGLLLVAELLLAYLVQIESYNISLSVHAVTDSTCEVAQSLEYLLHCFQREQTTRGRGTLKLQYCSTSSRNLAQ